MTNRRQFLGSTLGLAAAAGVNVSPSAQAEPVKPGFAKSSNIKLGMVTYNIGKDWDIPTLIRNCTEARFDGVELRTTHKHGVEVSLTAAERAEVKRQFADSPVQAFSLGSTFDFHTPDAAKLKKDIEDAKAYMVLAHDIGATGIKVRPNGLPKEVPVEKTLEQIGRSLRELGEFGDSRGLQIRLEVHGPGTSAVPYIKTIMDVADRPNVGVCWNSNQNDLDGAGFDANFDLVKNKIVEVHLRDLFLEEYPFRRLLARLNEIQFHGYTLAEIPESTDPVRVMKYFRGIWLAYQGLL
ncbi:MAG TPA: sugar phosphate isomerase/epimerase family protein [Candidatus Limnocylindria bacterium]|nr:sugar phosphate isomerase/epimerase family protein [Candidatus Limnocylindria bacterium]